MATQAIVEVQGLAKSFRVPRGGERTVRDALLRPFAGRAEGVLEVLRGVDFTLGPGEALGVMGRNGCGKSTLLKLVCGIYRADAGTIRVREPFTPVLELGIGWNPTLDAIDNTLLLATVMGLSLREARERIPLILEFAGLERFARLPLKHYSSGMAARLAYAVAFSAARGILVLDEILAVGDAEFRSRCEVRYRELRAAGHAVLLVSHDPRTVVEFCDRALLIEEGRIAEAGAPDRVADAYLRLGRRDA